MATVRVAVRNATAVGSKLTLLTVGLVVAGYAISHANLTEAMLAKDGAIPFPISIAVIRVAIWGGSSHVLEHAPNIPIGRVPAARGPWCSAAWRD